MATFPSRQYNIDDYPALKDFLLSFGVERLEQTGKEYIIDGEKVKARRRLAINGLRLKTALVIGTNFLSQK